MGLGGVLRVLTLSRGSWIEEGGEEWMRVRRKPGRGRYKNRIYQPCPKGVG